MTIKIKHCFRCNAKYNPLTYESECCRYCSTRLQEITIVNVGEWDNTNGEGLFQNLKAELQGIKKALGVTE